MKENKRGLIIKVPASKAWVGIGTFRYMSPWIIVCEKISEEPPSKEKRELLVNIIFHKEYNRSAKKEVYQKAQSIYDKIGTVVMVKL